MRLTSWDYDTRIATEWLRQGNCNGCGECCLITIKLGVAGIGADEDARDGGTGTSEKGVWHQWDGNGNPLYWKIENINHDEPVTCFSVYGCPAPKAYICEAWPLHPSQVECFNNCSYRFVKLRIWEFEPDEGKEPPKPT